MAMKILAATAAKSKQDSRRTFLKTLGGALAEASAVAVLPAAVAAMLPAVGGRSKLTDHEVDLIRELFEELAPGGSGALKAAKLIAEKFDINERTVKKDCLLRAPRTDASEGEARPGVNAHDRERITYTKIAEKFAGIA